MARMFLTAITIYRILKNTGGRYIPQYKNPGGRWVTFTELGVGVNRASFANAQKWITNRAKTDAPQIDFFDLTQARAKVERGDELQSLAVFTKLVELQALRARLKAEGLTLTLDALGALNREINATYEWLFKNGVEAE